MNYFLLFGVWIIIQCLHVAPVYTSRPAVSTRVSIQGMLTVLHVGCIYYYHLLLGASRGGCTECLHIGVLTVCSIVAFDSWILFTLLSHRYGENVHFLGSYEIGQSLRAKFNNFTMSYPYRRPSN